MDENRAVFSFITIAMPALVLAGGEDPVSALEDMEELWRQFLHSRHCLVLAADFGEHWLRFGPPLENENDLGYLFRGKGGST